MAVRVRDWRNCNRVTVDCWGGPGGTGRQEQYLINQGVTQNKTMGGGSLRPAPLYGKNTVCTAGTSD